MSDTTELKFLVGTKANGEQLFGDFMRTGSFISSGNSGSGHASYDEGTFVVSLLQSYSSEELKIAMVDPKQVQLLDYEEIPHLFQPIAYETEPVRKLFDMLLKEVGNRHELFVNSDVKNIQEYNLRNTDRLPSIVLLATEIADLMMTDSDYYEKAFISIAEQSSVTGIYLYIATQRPSTDVITGGMIAAIPGRIVFTVSNKIDSERLLNGSTAASKLNRQGSLLYSDNKTKLVEVQASYTSNEEIGKIVKLMIQTKGGAMTKVNKKKQGRDVMLAGLALVLLPGLSAALKLEGMLASILGILGLIGVVVLIIGLSGLRNKTKTK